MKPLNKRNYFKEYLKLKMGNAANIRKLKKKQKLTAVKKNKDIIGNIKPMWKPALKHIMDSAKNITKKYLQFNTRGQRFTHFLKAEKQNKQIPSIDLLAAKYQSSMIGFKPKFVSTPIARSIEPQNTYNNLCAIVDTAAESCFQLLFQNEVDPLFEIKEKLNRLRLSKVKEKTRISELKKNLPNKQNRFVQNMRKRKSSEVLTPLPNTSKISSLETNQFQNPNINKRNILGNKTFCSEFERNISDSLQCLSNENISLNIFDIDNNGNSYHNGRKRTLYNPDVQKDSSKDFFKKKFFFESPKKGRIRSARRSNYKLRNNPEKPCKLKKVTISETQRPMIESESFETFGSFDDFNFSIALSPLNCNYLKQCYSQNSHKEQTNNTNAYKISKNIKYQQNVISGKTKRQKIKYLDGKRSSTPRETDSDCRFEEIFKCYKGNNNLTQFVSPKNSLQLYKNSWCTEHHSNDFFRPIIQNSPMDIIIPNSTFKSNCSIQKLLVNNKKLDHIKEFSSDPSVHIEKNFKNWLNVHKVLEWLFAEENDMDSIESQ